MRPIAALGLVTVRATNRDREPTVILDALDLVMKGKYQPGTGIKTSPDGVTINLIGRPSRPLLLLVLFERGAQVLVLLYSLLDVGTRRFVGIGVGVGQGGADELATASEHVAREAHRQDRFM
ncbi:MAG: hypothetical protein GY724_00690, partial [Actinomycetia bacterium]|nr:hypothetical protein [Actinomycetes bacterium]